MAHEPVKDGTPISAPNPTVAIVSDSFAATNGAETPFGRRWGGDVFRLSDEHLAALKDGQTLALDVQNEYVVFLKRSEPASHKALHDGG